MTATAKPTPKKNDLVEYTDRGGTVAMWKVQAVRDDGALQLTNLQTNSVCLGVSPDDITRVLTEAETIAVVQALEEQTTSVQGRKATQGDVSSEIKLVLDALEAVADRIGAVTSKDPTNAIKWVLVAIAFFLGGFASYLLWTSN